MLGIPYVFYGKLDLSNWIEYGPTLPYYYGKDHHTCRASHAITSCSRRVRMRLSIFELDLCYWLNIGAISNMPTESSEQRASDVQPLYGDQQDHLLLQEIPGRSRQEGRASPSGEVRELHTKVDHALCKIKFHSQMESQYLESDQCSCSND